MCFGVKINWGAWLVAGVLGGIVYAVVANVLMIVSGTAPLYAETAQLWKPMIDSSWFTGMIALNFIAALLLAFAFAILHKALPYSGAKAGAVLGFTVWLAMGLPGMLVVYWTMAIPTAILIEWIVNGLLQTVLGGAVIGAVYKIKK